MTTIPTPLEAKCLWLSSIGMTLKEIAKETSHTTGIVNAALVCARKKATASGLRILVTPPPEPASQNESGFSLLKRLAVEAGLTNATPCK